MSNFKHGKYGSPEYISWSQMIQRCLNPKCRIWKDYGGRGITISDEWRDFKNFYRDMEDRPSLKHTLERIDNGLGYCKSNCQWATRKEQNNNRRSTIFIEINGQKKSMKQWVELAGLHYKNFHERYLRNGEKEIDKLRQTVMFE
jgi:hypothetical protein